MSSKPEATKLTAEQRAKLTNRRTQPWRHKIIEALKTKPLTDIELYDATRPDRMNISDTKKKHNVASQLTYLKEENYVIIRDIDKLVLIADNKDNLSSYAHKYL